MRTFVVTPIAGVEAVGILAASLERFGTGAAERYRSLLRQAYADPTADPQRNGVYPSPGRPNVFLFHIRHSRAAGRPMRRVGRPRHVIAFRSDDRTVEIIHLLHDSMDIPARLKDLIG